MTEAEARKTIKLNYAAIALLVLAVAAVIYLLILAAGRVNADIEVLEIGPDGTGRYYDRPLKIYGYGLPDEEIQKSVIRSFVVNTRGIPRNAELFVKNGPYGLGKAAGAAEAKAVAYLESLNVAKRLGVEEIRIPENEIECVRDGEYRWRVRWHEITENIRTGETVRDCRWECVMYTAVIPPSTKAERMYNPTGFYITDYDIDLLKETKK